MEFRPWSRRVPGGVDDGDEVEETSEGAEEGADFVGLGDGDGVGGFLFAGGGGRGGDESSGVGVDDLEGLVEVIDGECDGAGEGLAEEPPFVVASVDDVDAADEEAGGEEAENSDGDQEGSSWLREDEVSESREEECEDCGEWFGAFLWLGGVGHGWEAGAGLTGGRRGVVYRPIGDPLAGDRGRSVGTRTHREWRGLAMLLLDEMTGVSLLEETGEDCEWASVEVVMEDEDEEEDEDDDFLDDDDDDDDDDDEDDEFLDDDDEDFLDDDEEGFDDDDDDSDDDEDL